MLACAANTAAQLVCKGVYDLNCLLAGLIKRFIPSQTRLETHKCSTSILTFAAAPLATAANDEIGTSALSRPESSYTGSSQGEASISTILQMPAKLGVIGVGRSSICRQADSAH